MSLDLANKMADLMLESNWFFVLFMSIIMAFLIAVGGLVIWTIIKWFDWRW